MSDIVRGLNWRARQHLKANGVTQAEWRRYYGHGDTWRGDRCGCPDDRCIDFHHDADEECGCLDVLLTEYLEEAQ